MTLLPRLQAPGETASGPKQGLFQSILAALAPDGEVAAGGGLSDLAAELGKLFQKAETALAAPDLSDAEISGILDALAGGLAALARTHPQLGNVLAGLLGTPPEGGQPGASVVPGSAMAAPESATGSTGEGASPRREALALPDLKQAIAGRLAAQADPGTARTGAEPAALQTAEQSKTGTGGDIAPLLERVQRNAPDLAAMIASQPAAASAVADPALPLTTLAPPAPAAAQPLAPVSPLAATMAALPAPPAPPVEPQQILGQIRAHVGEQGRIRVDLKPEGLGMVQIDLSADEAGQLRVVVRAENAAVLNSLRGDREGLATMLREAGHDVGDQSMSFNEFGRRDTGRPGSESWANITAPAEAEGEEAAPALRVLSAGLDIRV